ncbi:MAG: hypothetical protein ACM3Q2_12010, partial [Syntrophothermus sp.]
MKKNNYLTISMLSVSLITLELAWTRIFSAEFFYTFAFLILSLAIMGLGLGALALRMLPFLRKVNLGLLLTATGAAVLAGPPLVFMLKLDFTLLLKGGEMVWKLIAAISLLSSSYFLGGICLARLFRENHKNMPKLYMADLAGSGAGVVLALILMNWFGTPAATYLSSAFIFTAAFLESTRVLKVIPLLLTGVMAFLAYNGGSYLENKIKERAPVIYKHWDAVSKIKVYKFSEQDYGINIDNAANTPVRKFDGNFNKPDSLKEGFSIDVTNLIKRFDKCTFLSLGAGGGQDVLMALQAGASEVHAVEVNPHINELMTTGFLSDFSGRIYHDPRVKVVTADARSYIRGFNGKFDVIYSLSSNSFAALASGAFALAENYLFTTEAFSDYWNALSPDGFMMVEHQFYVPRLVSELKNALKAENVTDANKHFAVYDLPKMKRKMILISKKPLTDEIIANAFGKLPPEAHNFPVLLYPNGKSENMISQIVNGGWEQLSGKSPVDISPCTDNKPFVAQLGMWKNLKTDKLEKLSPFEFTGFPLSKIIMVIVIAIVLLIIIPLNFIPYVKKGEKLKAVPWLYFFSIGMAFMMVEVILIQKYALFIGSPVYSIATILLALLLSSGIGSRFAESFKTRTVFSAIAVWILADIFIFTHLLNALSSIPLLFRIIITILLVSPLGFFMGMPFPKGALKVGELIDWGFAVNGAGSVLGSTLIVLISISYGFNIALIAALLMYLAAFGLMSMKAME